MGYISKDIAVITEPERVTLSALPNFVTFASKPGAKTYLEVNIKVNAVTGTSLSASLLNITDPTGAVTSFMGTNTPTQASGNIFYLSADTANNAENLRQAMLNNRWLSANFEITIPFEWEGGAVTNGDTINIKSKGAGTDYNIQVIAPNNTSNVAYNISWVHNTSVNNDSISGEASTAEIELDVYTGADVFLGADDRPITVSKLGHFATTLQKTYAGAPVWFELNALFSQNAAFKKPTAVYGWFNPETVSIFRFVAKVHGYNSFPFYQSNALYVLNGYGLVSDEIDLTEYTYNGNTIKLLTNKPRTPYIKGQREYLNFIFEDPQRDISDPIDFTLRVAYRAYSSGDNYLGAVYAHPIAREDLQIVNTCVLDIDNVLDAYPKAGIVRVALARDTAIVSNDLEYTIRPECLHNLRQFTFLNRLGGWDTFNFDAPVQDDIKPQLETFNKTLTPAYSRGDSLETVYSSNLENTFTVEGAPVSDEVATWLKELAAARVVLENDFNYIIKEDFTLRKSASTFNMQTPIIKYRLSETYTND